MNGLSLLATTRNILSVSASYFVHVGLICPVVLQEKLFFKDICNLRSNWDAPVTEGSAQKWSMHLNELKTSVPVPAFIFDYAIPKTESTELHGFADSSKDVTLSGLIFSKIVTA